MIRNDFLCLGKHCRTPEGATLYSDLPSGTTRCPVCGSKRVQKIFSANVGTGMARKVDGMLDQSGLREQLEARDRSRAVEQKDAHDRPRPGDAVVAGFAGNMGALVAKATAPWATGPNGQNPFAGASAGARNKAATVQGLAIHNGTHGRAPMPAGRTPVPGGAGGPAPMPGSPAWGERPKV